MMSYLQGKKFGFVGGGQMAAAIFGGLLSSGAVAADAIHVTDVSPQRLQTVADAFGVHTVANDADTNGGAVTLAQTCDVVFLAVKPQYLRPVLETVSPHFRSDSLVISIVGGCTLATLESFIKTPVIRTIPNTPMMVQEGVVGISRGQHCTDRHVALAKEVFDLMGSTYILPESLIEPLNSISGCGVAYAYIFIEALADGAVAMGLPRDMALQVASQMVTGSAKMVQQGEHPGRLKDNVCSPGGATIAGVRALEMGGFRGTVMDAVQAGMKRMIEVGKNI